MGGVSEAADQVGVKTTGRVEPCEENQSRRSSRNARAGGARPQFKLR